MPELRFEEVDEGLVEEWRRVHNEVIPSTPLSTEEVRERLTRFHLEVAYAGDLLVGCSTVRPAFEGQAGTTVIVRVLPAHRRQGYGEQMWRRALERVGDEEDLQTVVWVPNADGLAFAHARGFTVEVDRYLAPGDTEPFLTLQREPGADSP